MGISQVMSLKGWALALVAASGAAGCSTRDASEPLASTSRAAKSANALSANALSANALSANALSANALSANGLEEATGVAAEICDSAGGRQLLEYLAICALTESQSVRCPGAGQEYPGRLGLAPEWGNGPLTNPESQRWVTACLLAHVNAYQVSVEISLAGNHPNLQRTADERATFTFVEGTFEGNIFVKHHDDTPPSSGDPGDDPGGDPSGNGSTGQDPSRDPGSTSTALDSALIGKVACQAPDLVAFLQGEPAGGMTPAYYHLLRVCAVVSEACDFRIAGNCVPVGDDLDRSTTMVGGWPDDEYYYDGWAESWSDDERGPEVGTGNKQTITVYLSDEGFTKMYEQACARATAAGLPIQCGQLGGPSSDPPCQLFAPGDKGGSGVAPESGLKQQQNCTVIGG